MKRLLDETTDDFTRALLVAGIEQRPPAGNQRKVLIALGAGSALGLFSSHALAWLGTGGGKLSLLGVALGMAGAAYAVSPWSETEASRGLGVPAAVVSPAVAEAPSPRVPSVVDGLRVAGDVAPEEPQGAPAVAPNGERTSEPAVRARPARARSGERPAVSSRGESSGSGGAPAAVAPADTEARQESASLDAEVRLVDDMHWAARRNDRAALARFVATYHASFPDGQLEEEVSAFEARLARPTTP